MVNGSPFKGNSALVTRLLLVFLFAVWSISFTAIGHLRRIFTPMELVGARFLPVMIFCLCYLLLGRARRRETVTVFRTAPFRFLGMGLCGVAAYNFFLYLGQSEIKPGAAALITTLSPLLTLVLAIPFLKERAPARRIAGIILAFAGLYFVVQWGKVGMGNVAGIGHPEVKYALITSLAPLSWTFYTILAKDLVRERSPLTVTYISLVIGTIPFLFVIDGQFLHTLIHMGHTHWLALFHLSVMSTLIGFWIWVTALRRLPATEVASYIYLNPPFAALFGWLLFAEEITGFFLLGSAVVLLGLYLSQSDKKSLPPKRVLR